MFNSMLISHQNIMSKYPSMPSLAKLSELGFCKMKYAYTTLNINNIEPANIFEVHGRHVQVTVYN